LIDYLSELNDKQREAVEHFDGPSLIIAGAGSGKTRVLTTRIAWLIDHGIDPFNILALTFTNKAAREMQHRIENIIGPAAKNVWMGTFHSIFARILRIEHNKIGYPRDFTIYDSEDSKNVIKAVVTELQLDAKLYKPSFVHSRISLAKNSFISARQYLEDGEIVSEDLAAGRPKLGEIYLKYTQKCFKSGAMDFDDLLIKTYELLDTQPDVLNKYQHFFKFILIDEFQDTNIVQYLIVKKIAAANRNLSVVGDDAQSIYSFRGANIKNILNFEKDYPELKVFKLEQNYRSTQTIVSASDNVIKCNKYRLDKNLWTLNDPGNKIKLLRAESETEEGNKIARSILNEKQEGNGNLTNEDFVVLYRTNAQSRAFEESFRRAGIDYRIIGSLSFYHRKEIKDVLAYFRLVLNPGDEEALKRIINYPVRGIGDTTFAKLLVWADEKNTTVWEIISTIRDYPLSTRLKEAIIDFYGLIRSFSVIAKEKNAYEAAHHIAKTSGLINLLYEDKSIEGIGRYENLKNLLSAIGEFSGNEENKDKDLGAFLQEVSLLTDADTTEKTGDKVTLMTVHSAKGLEFPVVYVVGLEENLFPSALSLNTREEIEEERRLFYVAMTRARNQLYLSYATTRFKWGNMNFCEPSRFLDEINTDFIEYEFQRKTSTFEREPEKTKPRLGLHIAKKKPRINYQPASDFSPDDKITLQVGMEVEHNRFGIGKVLQIEGENDNIKATIFFHDVGQKQILIKYAKMRVKK
jgi:DNA helicase II / ATP-dependent DNA helicase PcrA